MAPLRADHPWVTHHSLPTFVHLVEVMDSQGWDWDQDDQLFEPRPGDVEDGHLPLNVCEALGYVDPERWTDQSGDIRNLPAPIWPSWAPC